MQADSFVHQHLDRVMPRYRRGNALQLFRKEIHLFVFVKVETLELASHSCACRYPRCTLCYD